MTEQQVNYETGEISPAPQVDPKDLATLFAKIAKVMGSLERLPKRGHNDHFNYDFIEDEDVYDAIRPALAAQGVAFFATIQRIELFDTKTIVHQTFTFADGKTGATYSCHWISEAIDKQDKAIAKASTTGLKYFLLKNFILSTGDPADDTDSSGATKRAAKKKPSNNGTEQAKAEFFASILKDIPYYENVDHIGSALKAAGFTAYAKSKEAKMRAALKKHAHEAANKEAA